MVYAVLTDKSCFQPSGPLWKVAERCRRWTPEIFSTKVRGTTRGILIGAVSDVRPHTFGLGTFRDGCSSLLPSWGVRYSLLIAPF